MFGKSGRIKYHQVVGYVCLIEIFESIGHNLLMLFVFGEVQVHICRSQINGFAAAINRMYVFCSPSHGIDRESASIAKEIEHTFTLREQFEQLSVLTLIYKEACLLTFEPVDVER